MRAVLITALLLTGCSKKSETKSEPAPEAKKEEAPAPEAPPAPPPPPPPTADAPKLDCDALVTPDDVAKACGGAKVEVGATSMEGQDKSMGICSRSLSEPGKKFPIATLVVHVMNDDRAAEGWMKLEGGDGAKPVAGLGDAAVAGVSENEKLKHTRYDVTVRKGRVILKLGEMKSGLVKNVPCTLEQLTELAKLVTPRLP